MGNLWLKIRVWAKILAVAFVLLYVIFFVAKNSSEQAKVWFWFSGEPAQPTVLLLAFYAFVAGALVGLLTRTMFRTIEQFKQMQERQRVVKAEKQSAGTEVQVATVPERTKPAGDVVGGSKGSSSTRAAG